ncbi:MAG: hypothetical protein MK130_09535, partial [Puniceicoccaceae bacterium]|nr:hypothetical protein [Puniceicoccaceae bacterium]
MQVHIRSVFYHLRRPNVDFAEMGEGDTDSLVWAWRPDTKTKCTRTGTIARCLPWLLQSMI